MAYNPWQTLSTNIATTGQFLGLPELKLSEKVYAADNLTGQTQPYTTSTTGLLGGGGYITSPLAMNQNIGNTGPTGYPVPGSFSSTPGGQVAGASTGGGDSQLSQLAKADRNPAQESEYQNFLKQMQGSAQSQASAELDAALGELDYQKEGLNAQSGQLDTQRAGALSTIDTETGRAQTEAQNAKLEATKATMSARDKALSTAQDIQKKNRNVLRALGILSSSAGGEMLTKPINEYGTQAGQLQQGLVDRLSKVEDWWMQRGQDFSKAKLDIETQYASLKENISRDLRFNDRQRLSAVKAASAALQQRQAEIQQQSMAYQQAAKQYSDNLLLQLAQIKMYQNPSADISAIYNTLLSSAQGSRPQQVGVQQTEEQRRRLSGLG